MSVIKEEIQKIETEIKEVVAEGEAQVHKIGMRTQAYITSLENRIKKLEAELAAKI